MSLYKKYIDAIEDNKKIKFSISFNRETRNWASGESKQIGYQVTAVPVEIGDKFESFTAFTGFNDCLSPINRQSNKRLDKAIEILAEREEKYLDYFKNKGIKFKEK